MSSYARLQLGIAELDLWGYGISAAERARRCKSTIGGVLDIDAYDMP